MKRFLTIAFVAAIGLATAGTASALQGVANYPADTPANGIGNSRHNLGAFGEHVTSNNLTNSTNSLTGTTEICIFCHTPHHTDTVNFGAPLWNRGIASTNFTAYGSTVGGNFVADGDVVGSSSLACLSCHDGVTTFDNLANAPGKKGGNSGVGASQGWTFNEETTGVITSGRLTIGQDLSNDHPMSVTYYGADSGTPKASLRATTTDIATIDVAADLNVSTDYPEYVANMAQNRWAVAGYVSDTATIADLLRGGKVECASCHDPHFNNKSWDEVDVTYYDAVDFSTAETMEEESNGLFLRRVGGNTGSGVCRTCHNK